MALPLYAVTLFVSAFILFLVQPMIAKMILPKLGGTPQVWNTCMVFFQTILLAGYAYTHFVSTRLKLRQQLLLHSVVLLVPFLVLIVPWKTLLPGTILPEYAFSLEGWQPPLGVNPIGAALYILLIIVGLPFFVVSTTAPLLQKWFVHTGHPAARDPYFLYGASNLGSMLSLPFYLLVIEPVFRLQTQALIWTGGYALLVLTVYVCVIFVWKPSKDTTTEDAVGLPEGAVPPPEPQPVAAVPDGAVSEKPVETGITAKTPVGAPARLRPPPSVTLADSESVTMLRRLKWIALAAVPSSMMLGVTTHVTTDLSPQPFIWVLPLELYLLSFILVFARWPVVWTEEPHKIMVYIQPMAIAFMLFSIFMQFAHSYLRMAIFADILGFFFTTMVCHGELAKDRPGTKHLTEFYLMMSIGGMLGGMFNGLLAPNIKYMFEFPAAIIAACLLRPVLTDGGWIATFVAGLIDPTAGEGAAAKKGKGHRGHGPVKSAAITPNLVLTLDIVLAVAVGGLSFLTYMMMFDRNDTRPAVTWGYGLPLMITVFMLFRPIRYGLAVALIIFVSAYNESRADTSRFRVRGYFGLIKVREGATKIGTYTNMIHGHIDHGMNFQKPDNDKDWGNPAKDYSRLATTYYHRFGPAGIVMERFCWASNNQLQNPEGENEYHSDARICASLVGAALTPYHAALPTESIASLWSEPPFATIGLGTGTMASYARPYQHCHYYEIDNLVKRLSLGKEWDRNPRMTYLDIAEKNIKAPYFTYLRDALARGAHVQVLMGDARLRMNLPYVTDKGSGFYADPEQSGGPENFYHMMVVDAFSSDAIPAHLITKQAIQMYFKHLTEEGILCVHTSNRFVDLVLVVSDVTADLGYACRRGHDAADDREKGHYTSEWVMVARKDQYLRHLREPPGYRDALRARRQVIEPYWTPTPDHKRYVWTDDFYNILSVLR